MDQGETGELAGKISSGATALLEQLEANVQVDSEVTKFFLGTLVRLKVITRDAGELLATREPHHLDSAFILFRALLDDVIRVFAVYGAKRREELVICMNAEALSQIHSSFVSSVEINKVVYSGRAKGLLSETQLAEWVQELKRDERYASLFTNREELKFRRMPKNKELLKDIEDDGYRETVQHANALYLRLSQHVHYSPFNFFAGRDAGHHQTLIGQLEECLIYSYKSLRMHFEYFKWTVDLTWPATADEWFASVTANKKP